MTAPVNTTREMMEWISVKELLPELYDFVLVCACNKGTGEPKPVAIARLVHENSIWDMLGNLEEGAYQDIEYCINKTDITHWMLLPLSPEK